MGLNLVKLPTSQVQRPQLIASDDCGWDHDQIHALEPNRVGFAGRRKTAGTGEVN